MSAADSGSPLHWPVLLGPVLDGLAVTPAGTYIDGTLGRGGHARGILERLGSGGRLLAVDRDPDAIAEAHATLRQDARVELIRNDFAEIENIVLDRSLGGAIDGIVFDLGVSSPQLDRAERGFSFRNDGPLDMRMDPKSGRSAAEWLAQVDERELAQVLKRFGEEPMARGIARAIVAYRQGQSIETTGQLASIVMTAATRRTPGKHPATKTFQAIRIFINDELGQLARALEASVNVLSTGGRLCVVSFHSLEDRIVKRFMRAAARESEAFRGMPDVPVQHRPRLRLIGRAIAAGDDERTANPRSRSARLRIAERT